MFGLKALSHDNDVAFDKPPDIAVLYFEKNGIRLNNADEHKSRIDCDSQSNHFLFAFSGPKLMQAVDLTLYFGRPKNRPSTKSVANYTRKSEERHITRRNDSRIEASEKNSASTRGFSTSGPWHTTPATHRIPSFCKLSTKYQAPF